MKQTFTYVALLAATICGWSQTDLKTYYATTNGLNQAALKTALYNIIKNPQVVGYDNLWQYFPITDKRADGSVWDMYSNNTYEFTDDGSTVVGMDREHAFPKSWWSSGIKPDKYSCYSDLFNLNPADAKANQAAKSNWTMGVVNTDTVVLFDNGVVKSGYDKDGYRVWEPADAYKGDFARTYMYVVTCYEFIATAGTGNSPTWSSNAQRQIVWNSNETYPIFTEQSVQMLLDWHHNDPVSEKELNRNEAIFKIQGNRNPFIDCPDFADYIWGNKKNDNFLVDLVTGLPFVSIPKTGDSFKFKGDTIHAEQQLRIQIKANNISKPIDWQIVGKTKGTFTLPTPQIAVNDLKNGRVQTIGYTSVVPAHDTVNLVLNSSELAAPVTVRLTAEARDVFRVLAPDIDDEAFVVKWKPSADAKKYRIDVFQWQTLGERGWTDKVAEDFRLLFPTDWTRSQNGFSWSSQNGGAVKLGSATNGGHIATPIMEMGDSVRVRVRALQTNVKDVAPTLVVWLDGATDTTEIGRFPVGTDTLWFESAVANSLNRGSVRFAVEKSNRTTITDIDIDSYENVDTKVAVRDTAVTGKSCVIDGLGRGERYFYTIQPLGGEFATVYGPFEVITGKTGLQAVPATDLFWKVENGILAIDHLPANTAIALYDSLGRQLYACNHNTAQALSVPLAGNGLYILHMQGFAPVKILKTR